MRALLSLLASVWRGSPIGIFTPGPLARFLIGAGIVAILLLMLIRLFT